MLQTVLCRTLAIDFPIFSVGFGAAAGPELVAAVSNAGACGVLGGAGQSGPYVRERIRQLRGMTRRPFGVNVILAVRPEDAIAVCLEEAIPILVLFWGEPKPWVNDAHRVGTKVVMQVGSVEEAKAAAEAGVDGIIAQGSEAGGHVRGKAALFSLLPGVVEAVAPVPVIASGGIASGEGIVAALALGAQGVSLGTRFVASEEAFIPREYKMRVVESRAEDTVYCENLFDLGWANAPHRVIRNRAVQEWEEAGRPRSGQRPGEGTRIGTVTRAGKTFDIPRYAPIMLTPEFTGDIEYAPFWAGESCALVRDIKPAAQIVGDLVREAETFIAGRLAR